MKASSKRKTAKRKASGDEDYEPAPAAIAGATANDSMTYPKQQSSPFIGVTKYKRTGRFEAHVWNSNTAAPSASGKRGRQLHLGSFSDGERAAKAYDMAALKLKGYDRATTNFPKENYHIEPFMLENEHLPLDEFVLRLRKWAQLSPKEESAHRVRAIEAYHRMHGDLPPHLLQMPTEGGGHRGYRSPPSLPYGPGGPAGYGSHAHPAQHNTVTTHQYLAGPPPLSYEGRLPPMPLLGNSSAPQSLYSMQDPVMHYRNGDRSGEPKGRATVYTAPSTYWCAERTEVAPLRDGGPTSQQMMEYLNNAKSTAAIRPGSGAPLGHPAPLANQPNAVEESPFQRESLAAANAQQQQQQQQQQQESAGGQGEGEGEGVGEVAPTVQEAAAVGGPHMLPADMLRAALVEDQQDKGSRGTAAYVNSAPDLQALQGHWPPVGHRSKAPVLHDEMRRAATLATPEELDRDALRGHGAPLAAAAAPPSMHRAESAPGSQHLSTQQKPRYYYDNAHYQQASVYGTPQAQHSSQQWGVVPPGWGPSSDIAPVTDRYGGGDDVAKRAGTYLQHTEGGGDFHPASPSNLLGQLHGGSYAGHYQPLSGQQYLNFDTFTGLAPGAPAKPPLLNSPRFHFPASDQSPRYVLAGEAAVLAGDHYGGHSDGVPAATAALTLPVASSPAPTTQSLQDHQLDVANSFMNTPTDVNT